MSTLLWGSRSRIYTVWHPNAENPYILQTDIERTFKRGEPKVTESANGAENSQQPRGVTLTGKWPSFEQHVPSPAGAFFYFWQKLSWTFFGHKFVNPAEMAMDPVRDTEIMLFRY